LASNAKDQFTIGTALENNDGNVDDLYVYANADFKNNVIVGSSSFDILKINAVTTASQNILIDNNANLVITGSGTIYYNGMDVLAAIGGGNNSSYADSAVYQSSSSYEQYGGGPDSYFSGTTVRDASNGGQGQIEIGHISASNFNVNDDIIRLSNGNSRITMFSSDIMFEFLNNNQLLISDVYNALNGGGGSPSITNVQSTGSGTSIVSTNINNVIYLKSISGDTDRITVQNDENNETVLINLQPQNYDYSIVVPTTASIGNNSNYQSEVFYCNNQGNNSQTYNLVSAQSFIKRVIVVKNISTQHGITLQASGSDTIDGSSTLTIPPNHSFTLHSVDNNGYKWYIIGKYS